jgi:hypothetical protein
MRKLPVIVVIALLVCNPTTGACGATRHNVSVIANTNPALKANPSDPLTMSQVAAMYYCQQMGIPASNIIEVNVAPDEQLYSQSDFSGSPTSLTKQIRD